MGYLVVDDVHETEEGTPLVYFSVLRRGDIEPLDVMVTTREEAAAFRRLLALAREGEAC
jgi:hypothetical protein